MAYTTTADVKAYAGVSGSEDDTLIGALVTAAQAAIDAHCDRTFEASADSTRSFTVGEDTDGLTLYVDADLCAITTVKTDADGDNTTVTSTEYTTLPRNATPYYGLKIKSSANKVWEYTNDREAGVTLAGKWAYSTSAPDAIAHACKLLATFYYRKKDMLGVPLQDVEAPNSDIPLVMMLLEPFRRH